MYIFCHPVCVYMCECMCIHIYMNAYHCMTSDLLELAKFPKHIYNFESHHSMTVSTSHTTRYFLFLLFQSDDIIVFFQLKFLQKAHFTVPDQEKSVGKGCTSSNSISVSKGDTFMSHPFLSFNSNQTTFFLNVISLWLNSKAVFVAQ